MADTLLGNPIPENAPSQPNAEMPHVDKQAIALRKRILLGKQADFEEAELEEIHSLWSDIFAKRGTKDANNEAKYVSKGVMQDGLEVSPLLQSRLEMWARTEWSPNMPKELRAKVKDFAGECEAIAEDLKKKGYRWLDEFREWIGYDPEKNAYAPLKNQAEPMNWALGFIDRQEKAMEEHPEIAGDTCLQQLMKIMRGGKAPMESRLKTILLLGVKQFEAHQWYELCTPAGTFDLRSGKLISKNNGLTMTVTEVAPDMDKAHFNRSAWKQFLEEDVPEKEKRDYLQLAVGFSLYGALEYGQDPLLQIWDGDPGAGKSQIFNDIASALGSYATNIDIKIFTTAMDDTRKQHEKALMFGKRFAITSELDENLWLSPDTLKQTVSTDLVHAEEKYKKPFDFVNECSFQMVTNYPPQVKNIDDKAVRRRIRVCRFTKTFTNPDGTPNENVKDPTLPGRAKAEKAIILGWAMEGARKFAENGFFLPDPPLIRKDTEDYFDSCDWFSAFLRDECVIGGEASDTVTVMASVFLRFQKWCDVTGRKIYGMDAPRFGRRLKSWNLSQHSPLSILASSKGKKIMGLALKKGTEASFLAEKQVYANVGSPREEEATPQDKEEAKEAQNAQKSAHTEALTPDPVKSDLPSPEDALVRDFGTQMEEMGRRIDALVPVERQKEIASLSSEPDTAEKGIRAGVERRLAETLGRLGEIMKEPADAPLMPDDEALLYLAWSALDTAKERKARKGE